MTRPGILFLALWLAAAGAGAEIPLAERRSGAEFMSSATRAMQDDEVTGPAALWLLEGEERWNRKVGAAGKSCADCHGDARQSMRGVAARYPAYDAARAAGDARAARHRVPRHPPAGERARP